MMMKIVMMMMMMVLEDNGASNDVCVCVCVCVCVSVLASDRDGWTLGARPTLVSACKREHEKSVKCLMYQILTHTIYTILNLIFLPNGKVSLKSKKIFPIGVSGPVLPNN